METIGSYQILRQIGAGGMGAVFLAEHRFLKRRSAIKMLLADLATRPDVLERFFAEARATSQLEHPGIVRIFDCEIDAQGRPYFVMEYLEGETLGAYLRRHGRLAPTEAAGFAVALADALGAAHERGIVHRDLKPDNIFVRPAPVPAIKLVDFGIAKLAEEFRAVAGSRTQTGTLLGTPPYMSPEQCRGSGSVDHRTDIYSLGCVLFEMLCGVPPFERDSTGGFLIAHITQAPPFAHEANPEVPRPLSQIIAAMLAKEPEDRPQTMREVADRLKGFTTMAGSAPARPAAAMAATEAAAQWSPPARVPAQVPSPAQAPAPVVARGRTPVQIPSVISPASPSPTTGAGGPPRTTLQSNAGELLERSLPEGSDDLDAPPKRKRGGLVVGGLLVMGVIGFTAWKVLPVGGQVARTGSSATTEPASGESAPAAPGTTPTAEAAVGGGKGEPKAGRPVARKTAAAAPEEKPTAAPAGKTRPRPASTAAPTAAGGTPLPPPGSTPAPGGAPPASSRVAGTASARARGFVIIDIDSEPTGALLCFEGDPRIISATRRAVQLPYADQQVTFLVDLPGYAPGRLTVQGNRDARKVVKLSPLPPGQGRRPVCSY